MSIRVYNTLTRRKEPFQTVRPDKVGMYVCGPTVYKPSHVGHMVGPVIFDTIRRYLTYSGYQVTLVINITDVDDKMIVQAQKQNIPVAELAERVTGDYKRNLQKLGVTGVDHMPKATEHIGDIVQIIAGLIDKGYAYPAGGDVYFDVTKDPDYGKLCNRDPEQLEAGARIEVSDKKRNPGDFALWKAAKPGEPIWDSPWGPGRPGWHIECSAMAMKYLGQTLDIHGGGLDLQFPHHENELAQSESYTGVPFVRYWMHNGLMKTGDDKMSKSKGNEIVVSELLQRHSAETLRFLLLNTHYRSPIDYSEERLEEFRRALEGFYSFFDRYERITGTNFYDIEPPEKLSDFSVSSKGKGDSLIGILARRIHFLECMDDDFNTGGAIGFLYEIVKALNRHVGTLESEVTRESISKDLAEFSEGALILKELGQILGIFIEPQPRIHERWVADSIGGLVRISRSATAEAAVTTRKNSLLELYTALGLGVGESKTSLSEEDLINDLAKLRAEARKKKDYSLADSIRARLKELNVTLEDTKSAQGR